MSMSNFEWIVVHDDGTTETVITDCIDNVIYQTDDPQPIAIVRGELK